MPKLFEDPGLDEYRGLNLRNLKIDEAWMVVTSHLPRPTWLYVLSDDCTQVSLSSGQFISINFDLTLFFYRDNAHFFSRTNRVTLLRNWILVFSCFESVLNQYYSRGGGAK